MQKYYTEHLLPIYIDAIHEAQLRDAGLWLFQEDGDHSHGIRKEGLAYKLREANWIMNLKHPTQSPDLNPIEAIWNTSLATLVRSGGLKITLYKQRRSLVQPIRNLSNKYVNEAVMCIMHIYLKSLCTCGSSRP